MNNGSRDQQIRNCATKMICITLRGSFGDCETALRFHKNSFAFPVTRPRDDNRRLNAFLLMRGNADERDQLIPAPSQSHCISQHYKVRSTHLVNANLEYFDIFTTLTPVQFIVCQIILFQSSKILFSCWILNDSIYLTRKFNGSNSGSHKMLVRS